MRRLLMIGGVAKTNHFILERLFRHDPRVANYIRWNPILVTASEAMDDSSSLNIRRLLSDAESYTFGSFSDRVVQRLSKSGKIRDYTSLNTPRGSSGRLTLGLTNRDNSDYVESQYDILARTLDFDEDSDDSDVDILDLDDLDIVPLDIRDSKGEKKENR